MKRLLPCLVAGLVLLGCGAPGTQLPPDGGSDAGAETFADDAGTPQGGDGGTACLPLSGEGTVVVEAVSGARRIAPGADHLYLVASGSLTLPEGRLLRLSPGGGMPETVTGGLTQPDAVAVTQDAAFVADGRGLWRIDLSDGTTTRINATLNNAVVGTTGLLVDGDALLYATGLRWLLRVAQDGSDTTTLYEGAPGCAVRGLARAGPDLYFLVAQGPEPGLYRVPVDGSAPAERIRAEPVDGYDLLLDGDRLLWAEGGIGQGRIVAAPLDGSATAVLATDLPGPRRLAKVGNAVYVKNAGGAGTPSFFQAVSACGLQPVGPSGTGPGDLLVHDGALYFTSEALTQEGYMRRLP